MPFTPPQLDAIRDAMVRDVQNLLPDTDVSQDSDTFARASATAAGIEGLYQHQAWMLRQIFPDQADPDYLRAHAARKGLSVKPATAATGTVRFTGLAGSVVPVGTVLKRADGTRYLTTASGVLSPAGELLLAAQAEQTGVAGNSASATVLALQSPPSGVDGQATAPGGMLSGTDVESDADLLDRLLDVLRHPPAGGNQMDYQRWAREVPGVSAAYVYPWRRGAGTVDVAITSAGGLPSAQLLADVQAYIDARRPVTARGTLVFSPELLAVPVTVAVQLSGTTLAAITPRIQTLLTAENARLAPGDTLLRSRLETLVSSLPGVVDRAISVPTANVVPEVSASRVQWCRVGSINVVLL